MILFIDEYFTVFIRKQEIYEVSFFETSSVLKAV